MANHVYFHISVDGVSDEVYNQSWKFEQIERKDYQGNPLTVNQLVDIHEQPFFSHVDREYDEDGWIKNSYDWYCNHVGAKWIDVEEAGDLSAYGYSAWSPPIAFVENLVQYLSNKIDDEVSASMTYEDEFRNFVGKVYVQSYWSDLEEDEQKWYAIAGDPIETDGDELIEQMLEDYPFLRKQYEGDDFDWFELYKDEESKEEVCPSELMDDLVCNFMENN